MFKEGVGYDSAQLLASVHGAVGAGEGQKRWAMIAAWAVAGAALAFLVLRRIPHTAPHSGHANEGKAAPTGAAFRFNVS